MLKSISLIFLSLVTLISLFFLIPQAKSEEKDIKINDEFIDYPCKNFDYNLLRSYRFNHINKLNIEIPNSQNWYENFLKASITGNYINKKFKDYFNSNVEIYFNDGLTCTLEAEIRIHGDFKDHINVNKLISSLDVRLKTGNILNTTKFMLLIPDTRGHENEIFTSLLMSELGFLSPRTFYTNVSLNSGKSHKYIFQEKITKEFVENNLYRESAIIETNEKYVWENDPNDEYFRQDLLEGTLPLEIGKINNRRWALLNFNNFQISLDALDKYNKAINSTFSNREINNYLLSSDSISIYKFESAVWALRAKHATENTHNRKFLYNKINEEFIPIYYDGDSSILNIEGTEEIDYKYYTQYRSLIDAATILLDTKIDLEDFNSKLIERGVNFSNEDTQMYIERFYDNLKFISNYDKEYFKNKTFPLEPSLLNQRKKTEVQLLFVDYKNNIFEICDQYLRNCSNIEAPDYKKLLDENLKINGKITYLYGINRNSFLKKTNIEISENSEKVDNFYIKKFNSPDINIDANTKTINIVYKSSSDRILVLGNELINGWNFNIFSDSNFIINEEDFLSRNDENLLTGCITFYNVNVENVSIEAVDMVCEDSVNFINSRGEISKINIKNSRFDALDIDFSSLRINTIEINTSKNDCADFSNGNYLIINAIVSNCLDKGFSIGEKSEIEIDSLTIESSKTGIAVKDSSFAEVNDFNGEDIESCFQIYQKKQEFGPAYLKIGSLNCIGSKGNIIQEGSIYEN